MQKEENKNRTDLRGQEAVNKLKELVKAESICLFCTELLKQPITTRPMSTQQVDDNGNIWFMSSIKSDKNTEIAKNNSVQLFYSNPSNSEYLSVLGSASISTNREKIEELWSPMAKAWFQDGKEDKDISLIKVSPLTAYYWDTKSNKMISMLHILAGMITGQAPDDGLEGTLNI